MKNISMYDMAHNEEATNPSNTKEKNYPTTRISSKQIPEIEDYDVGDKIEQHIIGKVISKTENKDGSFDFTIEDRECGLVHSGDIKKMMESGMSKENYNKSKKPNNDKAEKGI